MPTAINSKAKPDTVLLLDFAAGNDEVDYSQYRTNLTNNTTYLEEANSARTAFGAPRTIEVSLDVQTGESGVLLELGTGVGSAYSYQISISGGTVFCAEDGSTVVSAAIPNLTASDRRLTISWAQFPDGANVRSELMIWNHAAITLAIAHATHAAFTPDPSHTLSVGARPGGGSAFSDGLDFYFVRIGRRFHSQQEVKEDWPSPSSTVTTTQTIRYPPLVPDRSTLDIADDGALVGPAHLWAGHAFESSDRRLVGPIVNVRPLGALAIDHNYDTPTPAWWRTAPGDDTLHMCAALLWCCPMPLKVNRGHVRVRVNMQNPMATSVATLTCRVYSLAGLPTAGAPVGPLTYHRTAAATYATDNGATIGAGGWLELGELPLAVDDLGFTWIAVAVKFDEASAYVDDTVAYVQAVTIDPYHLPSEGGGLDFEGA